MASSEQRMRVHPYYGILALLALVGLVAIGVRLIEGMRVTALSSPVAWGMWVAFYTYFAGLSTGSFLLSTLIYVFGMHQYEKVGRMALLSALFALVAAMILVWIDLGHPWRFWKVFTRWNYASVLAWEVLVYLLYTVILVIGLWALMRCDLAHLALTVSGWRGKLYRFLTFGFRCPESEAAYRRCHAQSMRVVRILGIIGIPILIMGGTGSIFAVVAAKPY